MLENKLIFVDQTLNVEAYILQNISQNFPTHYHDHYVIGLVEQGNRLLNYKTSCHQLEPQDFLLINPGDSHRCVAADKTLLSYRSLHISTETMQAITGSSEIVYFTLPVLRNSGLQDLFLTLHHLISSPEQDNAERKKELFTSLIKQLAAKYVKRFTHTDSYIPKTMQARQYIDDHYMSKMKISQICKEIHISPTSLFMSFGEDFGISPRRYLLAKKVAAAKNLLQDMDVKVVAIKLGFFDHSHFTRSFKSITGFTPIQYKKSLCK